MLHKSESVLSLTVSGPVPPMGFPQSGGAMCAPGMMGLGCSPSEPPEPRPASPIMAAPTTKRVYLSTTFAEPPSTVMAGYERPMYYSRPCSPPPAAGPRTASSGRQVPIRRRRDAYDYDDEEAIRAADDDDGERSHRRRPASQRRVRADDDDDYTERSQRRRRAPSLRGSRSAKDTTGAERVVTSTMSRSGSRLRVFRFERDFSEAGPAGRAAGSRSRLDDGRCTCTCGAARTASRGRMSGIRIRPRREEAEEMYVVKKRKGRKKKKNKQPAPPPPQPGIVSYLRSLVGFDAPEDPAQKPDAADSNSGDDDDYEVTRLDRAELERLCRQMNVRSPGDDKEKK